MKTRRLIGIFVLFFVLCLGACGLNSSDQSDWEGRISFEEVIKTRESAHCQENNNICATVSVRYPEATTGDDFIAQKINQFTQNTILESLAIFSDIDKSLITDLDIAMQEFIKLYDEFIRESDFFTVPWELKINGEVTYQSDRIVSITLENQSYTGGAHPNAYTHLLNFDAETGEILELEDIITSPRILLALIERNKSNSRAKASHNDQPSIELASESTPNLPSNFAIQRKGILFFYNPYEIGSYADGSYSFFLTFDELKGVLKKNVLFKD